MREIKSNKHSLIRKFFIRLCRIFGFEIIDQNNFNIPTSNKLLNENLSVPGKNSITIPLGEVKISRPIKSLDIILRTCMNVEMLSQTKKRIFEKNKFEYSYRTLRSIIKSILYAKNKYKEINFKIYIIDHNSQKNQIESFENELKISNINYEIRNLEFDKFSKEIKNINEEKKEVSNNQKSNMSNIHQSLVLSKDECNDLVYFVEDDYIHQEISLLEIMQTFERLASQTNEDLVICPSDYPYLYTGAETTRIYLGQNRHWRQINQTLCTFLTSKKIIKRNWIDFTSMCKFEHYPFEKPLHKIYQKELCISPIPSLATHFTNINSVYGLSPTTDWKKLWEENEK